MRRVEHPSGGSTLITSAPRSANILPHNAPFSSVKSSSRNPFSNSDGIGELNLAQAPPRPDNPVSSLRTRLNLGSLYPTAPQRCTHARAKREERRAIGSL